MSPKRSDGKESGATRHGESRGRLSRCKLIRSLRYLRFSIGAMEKLVARQVATSLTTTQKILRTVWDIYGKRDSPGCMAKWAVYH